MSNQVFTGMMKNQEQSNIFRALEFAAHKHQNQKRKGVDGIPYINHPIEVSKMIACEVPDVEEEMLVAALLHDTLEDTNTSARELELEFGKPVMEIVTEVSDDMKIPSSKRRKLQIENAAKLSYAARCIRIADKACNIRDILHTRIFWPRKRKLEYVDWAIAVVNEIRNTNERLISVFDGIVAEAAEHFRHKF